MEVRVARFLGRQIGRWVGGLSVNGLWMGREELVNKW